MLNQYSPVPRARSSIVGKDATRAQIYAGLGKGIAMSTSYKWRPVEELRLVDNRHLPVPSHGRTLWKRPQTATGDLQGNSSKEETYADAIRDMKKRQPEYSSV